MTLYDSGIRPLIDSHLKEESEKLREYNDYWSASSAGYCYRRLIFERLKIPPVTEDARKQRVFSSGHIFHEWVQDITKKSGLSIAQELELQDEELMIRGHIDDLVLVGGAKHPSCTCPKLEVGAYDKTCPIHGKEMAFGDKSHLDLAQEQSHLILYDYKTAHSKWFEYAKSKPVSHYNLMQLGTYMYMVRNYPRKFNPGEFPYGADQKDYGLYIHDLTEARILKISKDDLRLFEYQVLWTPGLEAEVFNYWQTLNKVWKKYQEDGYLPACSCHMHENGFLAREAYNPFFYESEPCSESWLKLKLKETE